MAEVKQVDALVTSDGKPVPVSHRSGVVPFNNSFCHGSVFFCHRSRPGVEKHPQEARLSKFGGAEFCFEMQIQCRFKTDPRGPVWVTGELRDGPMKLNLVTRALCRVLLAFIQKQAAARGMELRYSFGDAKNFPALTVPLLSADRIIVSDSQLPLPVDTDDDRGTWQDMGGVRSSIDRASLKQLRADRCYTFILATTHIDWNEWSLTNIPGVGSLDLKQFWGNQGLYINLFDESSPHKGRNVLFEMHLASVLRRSTSFSRLDSKKSDVGYESQQDALSDVQVEGKDAEVICLEDPEAAVQDDGGDDQASIFSAEPSTYARGDPNLQEDDNFGSDDNLDNFERQISSAVLEQLNESHADFMQTGTLLPTDAARVSESSIVTMPWYLVKNSGDLWWCIVYKGRSCWRHHSHVVALCAALGNTKMSFHASHGIQDIEAFRRKATSLLTQRSDAPGLLEEFTHVDLTLANLLSGEYEGKSQVMQAAIVEAEGRIAERRFKNNGMAIQWQVCFGSKREVRKVSLDLRGVELSTVQVAGMSAVSVATPGKVIHLVAKDEVHLEKLQQFLRNDATIAADDTASMESDGPRDHPTNGHASCGGRSMFTSLWALKSKVADTGSQVLKLQAASDGVRAISAAGSSMFRRDAPSPATIQYWPDPLQRWPRARIVVNNHNVYLGSPPQNALQLSAETLRTAVAAQKRADRNDPLMCKLAALSLCLKCVKLDGLSEQDLWGFWVNVFHSLVIHAQLAVGRPRNIQQILAFYNNCSYLVAGHLFSLVEIEHNILRKNMTKPKTRFTRIVLSTWPRSDEDLERRPCHAAPECSSAAFGCRPDWRLNLILNAGNTEGADAIPIFEPGNSASFESTVQAAMDQMLSCCRAVNWEQKTIDLPYNLYRYRDDAPDPASLESTERRWAKALFPDAGKAGMKIGYRQVYRWSMREHLDLMVTTVSL
mmetsp:Transcript_19650/g.45792  ORF Transcript_19650/g.45792 Transcript_19650/m.45792 type:complete len:945 (-) Transcript_19650:73-2907(-)